MCFIQVERWLCFNQACPKVQQRIPGTVNVCEGQKAYHATGDVTAFQDCPVAMRGEAERIPYNAGRSDFLCVDCNMTESRQDYQQRRQSQYMSQNRSPPMAPEWEEIPDWNIRWMFNQRNEGGEGS
jgi:hypothetical protein